MKLSDEVTLDRSRITALSLGLSRYAPRGATLVAGVLLIEIGRSFGVQVGVANQLNAARSLLSLLTALAMGVLSIKYNMRFLHLSGLGLALLSTVGFWASPSFQLIFPLYTLNGVAYSLVYPMTTALVGELFTEDKRADAFSVIFAVPPIITVFGAPIVAYIGDWRMALMYFAVPIAAVSLILARAGIPELEARDKGVDLVSAFKSIIGNRSALSCLMTSMLNMITWQIIGILSISFLREHHSLSKEVTSLVYSGFAVAVFVGALFGGKVVNWYRRKPSSVCLTLVRGLCAILFVLVPNAYVAVALGTLACFVSGLGQPAMSSLTVEQIPEIRGAIMSFSSASGNLGSMIGAAMAGFLLITYGWVPTGVFFEAAGILAGVVLHVFALEWI
jgi:predicted MFS family arabinose efflux permease